MQKPINFDNQIVQPTNLDFLSESSEKAIKENFEVLFNGEPGIVDALSLTGTPGDGFFTVTPGVGYTSDGERIEVYTGTNFGITWTGTQSIYLTYQTVNYNPDPSVNPSQTIVTSVNPIDGLQYPTESYIFPVITLVSGVDTINLGEVTADTSGPPGKFVTSSTSGTQTLLLAGFLNLKTNTFDGGNITSGTLDSNLFANPLNYDFWLGTGTSIFNTGSGSNSLGSASNPFGGVYSDLIKVHTLEGFSPIEVTGGGFILKSGSSIESDPFLKVRIDSLGHGVEFGSTIAPVEIIPQTLGGNLKITALPGNIEILGAATSIGSTDGTNTASVSFTPSTISISSLRNQISGPIDLLGGNILPPSGGGVSIGSPGAKFDDIYAQNMTATNSLTTGQILATGVGSTTRPVNQIVTNEIIILGTGTASGTAIITPDVALYWPLYFRR